MQLKNNGLFVFVISIAVLVSWFPDYLFNYNTLSRALPIVSYCESGHLYFDKYESLTGDRSYINGHVYSDKAPLPVFIVLPMAKLIQSAGFFSSDPNENIKLVLTLGGYVISALPLLILMTILFQYLEKDNSNWKNYWLATLPFMSCFCWIYNASFYGHIFAGFLVILCYYFLEKRKLYLAGLLASFVFLTEYPPILLPVFWLLQLFIRERKSNHVLQFGIGAVPALIGLLAYNYFITGHLFTLGYDYVDPAFETMKTNYGFSWPKPDAFWGLTFSLYRGIFVYAPILLPVIILSVWKFSKLASFKAFILHAWYVPFFAYIILISGYFMWNGGWAYGPRHLIPPLLFILFY
ncbi:MAG: hypothetical protein EOP53_15160, partial [Sphingobacteriales bacterium]